MPSSLHNAWHTVNSAAITGVIFVFPSFSEAVENLALWVHPKCSLISGLVAFTCHTGLFVSWRHQLWAHLRAFVLAGPPSPSTSRGHSLLTFRSLLNVSSPASDSLLPHCVSFFVLASPWNCLLHLSPCLLSITPTRIGSSIEEGSSSAFSEIIAWYTVGTP